MITNIGIVDDIIQNNFGVTLEKEIGRGKYGIVYSGVSDRSKENCAIKVISLPTPEIEEKLRDVYGDNDDAIERIVREMATRFEAEIISMKRLGSQSTDGSRNIIKMNNHILTQDGIYFYLIISMELALPLKRFLATESFTVDKVIELCYGAAQGLRACHNEGIIHRDIKEDNLFLDASGRIKIGDFGVANIGGGSVSKKTEGVGTPHYMAPEIKNDQGYDQSVDIYSLGIVMYMIMNNNRPPFYSDADGINERDAYNMRMSGKPLVPPAYAPASLSDIILKCCRFDPSERYRNVTELMNDLEDVREELTQAERNAIVPYPKREFPDKYWWDAKFSKDETGTIFGSVGEKIPQRNILLDTIGVFKDLLQKFGDNSAEGKMIKGVHTGVAISEGNKNQAERMVKLFRRIIIIMACVMVLLSVALLMMYPKTAVFYSNTADGRRIYVKYLFLPERKLTDYGASYLSSDGHNLYFSKTYDNHKLCKASIWNGKETLLYDAQCEYDVVIGDYIYFTDYGDGEKLYRIKKDGTGLQCLIDYQCRELRNNNGSLEFLLMDTGSWKTLDVQSIQ